MDLTRSEKLTLARGEIIRPERAPHMAGAPVEVYVHAGKGRDRLRAAAAKRGWKLQQAVQALIDAVLEADICDAVLDDEERI